MRRLAANRRAQLVLELTNADGTAPEDAIGDVPVTVVRDDGSLVSQGIAQRLGPGRYAYTLTPADTAQLDRLTVEWNPMRAQGPEAHVESVDVVGRHWFEVAALRSIDPLQDVERYTVDRLERVRDAACAYLELAVGVAYVPSYAREVHAGYGSPVLALEAMRVRTVRRVTVDGVVLTAAELAEVKVQRAGALYRARGWKEGTSIEVVVEHGRDAPDSQAVLMAQLLTRRTAVRTFGEHAIDDRARGIATDVGTIDLVVASANVATDVPEVNAWIARQPRA